MDKKYIITRKIKLYPVGDKDEVDRVYQYLRDGIYNQNKAFNILLSHVYTSIVTGKTVDEINLIYKKGKRNPKENNPDYSLYGYGEIVFSKGMPVASTVGQKVKAYFGQAKKDGLFKGKVSLQNRKLDAPLWIEKATFSFYHEYETHLEFLDHLYKKDLKIYMKFPNKIIFDVNLGNNINKSREIRSVFKNIFEEQYEVLGSSIQIDDGTIILNLTLKIPVVEIKLDENTVVGVDLGVAVPAFCALNNNDYVRLRIGSADDFIRMRTKLQSQRRRLQAQLKNTNGGHGRKKKLKALDRLHKNESNFVATYCHMVSRRIVDFAVKNNAKYINLECLKGYDSSEMILRNWSYYKLQQYVIQKAERYGIEVRFVNPCYTSQVCSFCGYWDKNQRKNQSDFVCSNPDCKSHNKDYYVNADYNAARNIAKSTLFLDNSSVNKISKKHFEEAKEYYNIIEE